MKILEDISEAEGWIIHAERELAEARRNNCSSAAGWRDELKRRQAVLAKLMEPYALRKHLEELEEAAQELLDYARGNTPDGECDQWLGPHPIDVMANLIE